MISALRESLGWVWSESSNTPFLSTVRPGSNQVHGSNKAHGKSTLAEEQRQAGTLPEAEGILEVTGGDQQGPRQRGAFRRGNSPLQGHRALNGVACLQKGGCAQIIETWEREERDEAGAGPRWRGAYVQGCDKVSK